MSRGQILDRRAVEDRQAAQASVRVRLEQVRDDIDELLAGEADVAVDDIEAVIFGVADDERAEVRYTQRAVPTDPPAALRILGEFLDGLANVGGRDPEQYAAYALRMMKRSKESSEYNQSGSHSRRRR